MLMTLLDFLLLETTSAQTTAALNVSTTADVEQGC